MHFISAVNSDKGLFNKLKEKGYILPSDDVLIFETSQLSQSNRLPQCVLENSTNSFWGSQEKEPYFTMDFGKNKVSLTEFKIYGIINPYTTAFNISGSNDGSEWDLIKKYTDLGTALYNRTETFQFTELTNPYKLIKIQSIESQMNGEKSLYGFGMFALEIYGVYFSPHYIICTQNINANINCFYFLIYQMIII